jgi:hypothetical protein
VVQNGGVTNVLPLMIAIAGVILVFVLPLQRAGMALMLLLGTLLALTLLDLGTNRPTSTDIGCFALALIIGGFAMLTKIGTQDNE